MKTSSGENETEAPIYRQRRFVLVLILIVIIASVLTLNYTTFHFFNIGTLGCGSSAPVSPRFTVFIDNIFRRPLPTINVTQGQTITIHAWNNGTVTHGFAIQHYFDQGTSLQSGQSCDLTFSASQSGTFPFVGWPSIPDPTIILAELNVNPLP